MRSLLLFNNTNVTRTSFQKHLRIIHDPQLKFDDHQKRVPGKIDNTIGLPHKLRNVLPRAALITIYKPFIRPHLHYGHIFYDQGYKIWSSFSIMLAWPKLEL